MNSIMSLAVEKESVTNSIAFLLPTVQSLYKQNVRKMMQPFGINGGQSALLIRLGEKDGQLQKELAKHLNVKAPSLTTMIDRMQRDGLLERRRTDADQRASRIFLTARGRQAGKRIRETACSLNEIMLADFRMEERLLLLRFMEQICGNLEKEMESKNDMV